MNGKILGIPTAAGKLKKLSLTMKTEKLTAKRLAEILESNIISDVLDASGLAAHELRRLHEENQTLKRCLFQMQEAAKERLSRPEPEHVAWMFQHKETGNLTFFDNLTMVKLFGESNVRWGGAIPLYTAPPKREWQGLTDEDAHEAFNYVEMVKLLDFDRNRQEWCENFAAYIEAKLRKKNT